MMAMRNLIAAAALVAVPMITLQAQVPGADSNNPRTWGGKKLPTAQARPEAVNDSAFVREALTGNMLEVRLGRLAESKASNPAVKQFAQRMITDHTNMQNQWAALAGRNRLQAKPALDPAQEQDARQLAELSGTDFDRGYMTKMLEAHRRDLDEFQRVGKTADAPEVRELAATGMSTIQQHLTMAQQLSRQIGVTNVAVNPQPRPNDKFGNRRDRDSDVREDLKDFVHEVADDHLMQVQIGQKAQRRARKPEVKQLADRMVDDFNKWQDRWTDLAKKNGFAFEPALGPVHRGQRDRVDKASDANFDRIYLSTAIEHLQEVMSDFQNEGRKARSGQVRNLVNDELHVVQQHLAAARRLEQKLNTRAEASDKGRRLSSNK